MTTTKKYWIIALRGFAATAIVYLHVISGWTDGLPGGGITGVRYILDYIVEPVLVRWAVPCFVMITGYLLLDPNKEIDLKKIQKYVLRMAVVILLFGTIYCLMESAATMGFGNI